MRQLARIAFISGVLMFPGCSPADDPPVVTSPSANPGDDGVGPYVSVAVDNHFHDVHPENHIKIDAARAFVIRNEGNNLHNVTFLEADINEDIERGEEFILDPVGERLEPGTYDFVCRFHADVGMGGEITVVE